MSEEANIEGVEAEKEPSSFKLIMALGIAGLISGVILVSTYIYTKPIIDANKAEAIRLAIFKVLPDCDSYKTLELKDGTLVEKKEDGDKKKKKKDKETLILYAGYNAQEEFIGLAIPGSEPGFQDIIATIFGYDATNRTIIGFEVLESKETPGLGDKIFKDADFRTNFIALKVEPEIIAVKKGEKQNLNEVETITGATISSKAIVRLLNKTMSKWQSAIDNYINENNISVAKKE